MTWLWWRHRIEYVVFRTLLCLWQVLPPERCTQLGAALAWFIHRVLPRRITRYKIAYENIDRAYAGALTAAEIDEIIHGMWRHLFQMLAEIAHLPRKLHLQRIHDVIQFQNKAGVISALTSGRPVLILSGHIGNWEMAVSVFGLFGFPMGVVARELENPLLNDWFRRFRQCTGHVMIAKRGCFDGMLDLLDSGGAFALLGDQDAGSGGVFVDFFGRPASCPKTIALLALQYNALICVGYAVRLNEPAAWVRYELGCEEVIDPLEIDAADPIREITRRYTAALERIVRRAPEQYFWVHRRWKSVPKPRAKKKAA